MSLCIRKLTKLVFKETPNFRWSIQILRRKSRRVEPAKPFVSKSSFYLPGQFFIHRNIVVFAHKLHLPFEEFEALGQLLDRLMLSRLMLPLPGPSPYLGTLTPCHDCAGQHIDF